LRERDRNFFVQKKFQGEGYLSSAEERVTIPVRIPLIRPSGTFSLKGRRENRVRSNLIA